MQSLLNMTFLKKSGYAMAAMAVLCAIFSFINAWSMEKKVIARVDGDSITVKGKSYSYTEINEIKKASLNNLKLMSNGSGILCVNKSCDGCGDLIRWAKQHSIQINDDSDASAENVGKKQNALTAVIVLVCIAVAFLIVFLRRM